LEKEKENISDEDQENKKYEKTLFDGKNYYII